MKYESSFKNLVRKKTMEYEYNQLMNIKQTHSKLNNLCYTKLELQNYLKLEVLNASEAQMLFKYRVRMASYGENFREKENGILCPLCYTHLDSQKMCYEYQPSGEGGTRSPPATPHHLQNPKWPPGGPKMADGVWKSVYP